MRKRHGCAVAIAFVLQGALGSDAAFGTHDLRRFELDADAKNGSAAGYDWSSLFPRDTASGEVAKVFVADGAAPPTDASYYTGGGSKDINDVTAWRHTDGDVAPDKNELTNAYAVAYRNAIDTGKNDEGDLIFYFGADRYANNGDAQIGFWFFRGAVGIEPGGTFSGAHTRGDILVLSDFTQGGKVGTVRVYRWVGSGGSDGPLDLLATGKECSGGLRDDVLCSTVNDGAVASPWSYEPKAGPSGTFPAGSFYEGAINVTRLVPDVECFSSYLAETRSSQSVDAQLKDLALGSFDTCPPARATSVRGERTHGSATVRGRPAAPAGPGPELARSGPGLLWTLCFAGFTFLTCGLLARRKAEARA